MLTWQFAKEDNAFVFYDKQYDEPGPMEQMISVALKIHTKGANWMLAQTVKIRLKAIENIYFHKFRGWWWAVRLYKKTSVVKEQNVRGQSKTWVLGELFEFLFVKSSNPKICLVMGIAERALCAFSNLQQ